MTPFLAGTRGVLPARGLICALLLALWPASAALADPVDDLRQALVIRAADSANPTETVLNFRRDVLRKRVAALKTVSELRRALILDEWKDDITSTISDKLRALDGDFRREVAERFTKALEAVARSGDRFRRLAAANLIAEVGPTVRSVEQGNRSGFSRTLAPLVARLADDDDSAVRLEALRALGNINADPQIATPVFASSLQHPKASVRRIAAESMGQMVRVVSYLQKRSRNASGVETTRPEVLEVVRSVTSVISPGLTDAEVGVRKAAAEVMQEVGRTLSEMIPDPIDRKDFAPEGRVLAPDEKEQVLLAQRNVLAESRDLEGSLAALKATSPLLAKLLSDPEGSIRLAATYTIESVATTRIRLRRRIQSVPTIVAGDRVEFVPGEDPRFKFLKQYDPFANFGESDLFATVNLLRDPDVRIRRSAVDVLELLEENAEPAIGALIAALNDPDRFVRWSAIRAIGNINPAKSLEAVVPLAQVLRGDGDNNLRTAAAATLEALGRDGGTAMPLLAQAIVRGDSEPRVAAIYAALAIGSDHERAVLIPALVESLRASDVRVRRAAAFALGRLAEIAQPAVPALRTALGDEDQEVRINASEAILNVPLTPGQP